MKNRARATLAVTALLALIVSQLTWSLTGAQSPAVNWAEAEPIGAEMPSAWFPEIHADQYGTVRLIWEAMRDSTDPIVNEANGGALMLSELRDGRWTDPSDIYVKDVLNAARPILASDETYLHLISRSPRPEGRITIQTLSALYYMRAPLTSDVTSAQAWTTPVRLTSGPAYWAQMQSLGDGRIIVVYNQIIDPLSGADVSDATKETRTALFSRTSDDYGATWTQPVRVSFSTHPVARSSLVISPVDGTLILAWDEGYDNLTGQGKAAGIYTATSSDGGASWRVGGPLDPPHPDERLVTFASRGAVELSTLVATAQTTMLVYRATVEDVLLYRLSADQGRTWSDERHIPNVETRAYPSPHHFDKLGLAADGDGRIILAFVGKDATTASGRSVQAVTYADGLWSPPHVVAAPRGYPEYPRLTVTGGNQVNLTYFVRDEEFVDQGHFVIWTVQGTTPAGPVAPAPTPTMPAGSAGDPGPPADVTAADNDAVRIVPYPTVPDDTAPAPASGPIEPPRSTISKPLLTASLFTFGFLALAVVAFKILKRLTGF